VGDEWFIEGNGKMVLGTPCLIVSVSVLFATQAIELGRVDQSESVSSEIQLSNAVADRFVNALRKRSYVFLTEKRLTSLLEEIRDFAATYPPGLLSSAGKKNLLDAIDRYVPEHFLNRHVDFPDHFSSDWDVEGAYLKFRDVVNTFKWQLWLALTRQPHTAEQLQQRHIQHDWLRKFLAGVPIRPGDGRPVGVEPDGIRKWASTYLERQLADPLSLLYDPMTQSQFGVFRGLMKRSAANGLYDTVKDVPVRALGARAHSHADIEMAYGYAFEIKLPFEDEIRSIWGGGAGAGPHLVFTSNAKFRGRDVYLDASHQPVFDIVTGPCTVGLERPIDDFRTVVRRWCQERGVGHIAYDDSDAALIAVRSAKAAKLKVANWFEADRISDAELYEIISQDGHETVSVRQLPPMNGPRRVGITDPRFFIVVQGQGKELAVIDLRTREFGLHFVSRLR